MNNNLLELSLNQGKQFNQYQTKIKQSVTTSEKLYSANNINKNNLKNRSKKEGFVSAEQERIVQPEFLGFVPAIQNRKINTAITNQVNQKEIDELKQLESTYNNLVQQYNAIQTSIGDSSLETISRTNSMQNPYLGKNIQFTDGTICYVTAQGVAKPYPSSEVFNGNAGSNGCPRDVIPVDMPYMSSYITGTLIPTTPTLIVGSPMIAGESCGSEGKNVYASKLVNNVASSYVGCYNDKPANVGAVQNDQRAMIWNPSSIDYATFDQCEKYALDNGYQYFALQNYSECLVSNDLTRSEQYGDGSIQSNSIPIWATATNNNAANIMNFTIDYGITVISGGQMIWHSNYYGVKFYIDCGFSGQEVQARLGQHDVQELGFPNDMLSSVIVPDQFGVVLFKDALNSEPSLSLGPGQYSCLVDQGWNDIVSNYTAYTTAQSFLLLQNDGNMVIYLGNPNETVANRPVLWASNTYGLQHDLNPTWVSSKNSFGRDYLLSGESLSPGQWISSENGCIQLLMQTDGNLVLYTSDIWQGCSTNSEGKTVGGPWVNGIYKLNEMGDRNALGKLGYIDSNSMLREYPDSMLKYSSNYDIYNGYDSWGNDITNVTVPDQTSCQVECSNNAECAGYVYQPTTSTCWIKNNQIYPRGPITPNAALILAVRKPTVNGTTTCSTEVNEIDTIQYDKYLKGQNMAPDTICNAAIVSPENQAAFFNIQNQMAAVAQEIASKMDSLYSQDNNVYEKLNMNSSQFNQKLASYKATIQKIKRELELEKNPNQNPTKKQINGINKEGMKNRNKNRNYKEGLLTMNDASGMLTDSDLSVLSGNYSYILWSILAVAIVTISINLMKKK
jgi:hypothetical protein